MRRIMRMISEVAQLRNKDDNARCAQIKEAYSYMDDYLDPGAGFRPATGKIAEALVVGDFPLYFARTISRAVYDRYGYKAGQWRDYTYPDSLPDYSTGERLSLSEFDTLEKRREKQEAMPGYLTETRLTIAVDDYAKQIDFSHRILVNDDLGAFNNIALKMGDSARRFEDFLVSALYDNALTQAALVGLGANYSGTGRLTTANLAIAWNAYTQRVDARGNNLQITPAILVIPPILRLTANQILMSEKVAELATNAINPLRGVLTVREDPHIAIADPNVPWYLFAAPQDVPGVSVVRMNGRPGPALYAKAPDKIPMTASGGLGSGNWRDGSFLTGDIELMVETTIGSRNDAAGTLVGVTDAQGIYYSSGTTP